MKTARLLSAALLAAAGFTLASCGPARGQSAQAEKTVTVAAARRAIEVKQK